MMHRSIGLILLLVAGLIVGRNEFAHAQATPTPTPSVSAVPGGPNAMALIKAMYRVMHHVRAVRESYAGSYTDQSEHGSVTGTANIGQAAKVITVSAVESVSSSYPGQLPASEVFEEIVKGRYDAVRRDYQYWSCWHIPKALYVSFAPIDFAQDIHNAANLGSAVVDGRPTWHVTAVELSYTLEGRPVTIPLDYYVDQANHRLVRQVDEEITSEVFAPGRLAQLSITIDFSHYGVRIRATLPPTCRAGNKRR